MNTIEQEFENILAARSPANLYTPISYILMQPGKRLRPKLVHMAVDMFGGDAGQAQILAMAFEMLHNFTLIHDDIMDQAPIRRGKETVYKKWDSNIAILSGDALAIMAFQQLLRLECDHRTTIEIAKVFSNTSLEICEGQQYDLDFETREDVTLDEYMLMIRKKTAVMFAGCLKAASLLMRADPDTQRALYDFGIRTGIAFQLADDLLDVYADTSAFGKTIGGDIRDNKKTYLYLKALEEANPAQRATLTSLFAAPTTNFDHKYRTVCGIYHDLDIKGKTETLIKRELALALEDLDRVKAEETRKQPFRDLVAQLIDRKK